MPHPSPVGPDVFQEHQAFAWAAPSSFLSLRPPANVGGGLTGKEIFEKN